MTANLRDPMANSTAASGFGLWVFSELPFQVLSASTLGSGTRSNNVHTMVILFNNDNTNSNNDNTNSNDDNTNSNNDNTIVIMTILIVITTMIMIMSAISDLSSKGQGTPSHGPEQLQVWNASHRCRRAAYPKVPNKPQLREIKSVLVLIHPASTSKPLSLEVPIN